ncbi:MAG: hypothetical protein ACE5HB_10945, partial [Terriglobia bacterium]
RRSRRPSPYDAKSYPAHDSHQGVTMAAVPVPDTPEAERIFGQRVAPTRAGFLPLELIITNDRDEPIEVALEKIVITGGGNRFEQVQVNKIAWALYPPPEETDPRKKKKPSKKERRRRLWREEAEAALRSRQLRARLVGPGATARGYLYFDLRRRSIDLAASSVYVPEVNGLGTGEGLFFFEVSLKPYRARKSSRP